VFLRQEPRCATSKSLPASARHPAMAGLPEPFVAPSFPRWSFSMIAGDTAPDFTLYDHAGRARTLSALLSDGPVVLFFFPIASSPICTAQACHFRN
jgi:hypothetical protein